METINKTNISGTVCVSVRESILIYGHVLSDIQMIIGKNKQTDKRNKEKAQEIHADTDTYFHKHR